MRYWEDFREGETFALGPVTVSEEEIIAFASRYDPQPFHVDPEAAKASPFGGLIASGWHTGALFMQMFAATGVLEPASLGSPGIEWLRWTAPMRPGDTLSGVMTIAAVQPSSKNPARGTVITESELVNQTGTTVMTLRARTFFARREPAT